MPKLDLASIPQINRTGYPEEFAGAVSGRWYRRLAPVTGLTQFTASHVVLKPGAWSSQRHWHEDEDEMLVLVSGEAVLMEDEGRTTLHPGDICAWPKGVANGHHIINESEADCVFVVIGSGAGGAGGYSDIDMTFAHDGRYLHRDGTPYASERLK